jgi:hypothetical protein
MTPLPPRTVTVSARSRMTMTPARIERLRECAAKRGYAMKIAQKVHTAKCSVCGRIPVIGETYLPTLHGSRVGTRWPVKFCLPCFNTWCVREKLIAENEP